MPPLETMDRYQTAVYWEKTGDSAYGEPILASPVELCVRWVNKTREATTAQGTPVTLMATVITDQELSLDSLLWQGTLDDWYETGSAGGQAFLMQVSTMDLTTDIKNRFTRYEAGLTYFRGSLP